MFLYRGPRLNGKGDLDRRRSRSGDIYLFPSLIEHACSAAAAELGGAKIVNTLGKSASVYSIFLIRPGLEALRFFIPDPPRTIRPLHCPTARVKGSFQQAGCSGSIGACWLSASSVGQGRFLARITGDVLDRNLRHATARCSGPWSAMPTQRGQGTHPENIYPRIPQMTSEPKLVAVAICGEVGVPSSYF